MKITIRQERYEDYKEAEAVVKHAFTKMEFSDQTEHELVARIRKSTAFIPELSLVAVDNSGIVGHILLSKIAIKGNDTAVESLALAPVSFLPEHQHKGIGSLLIREALKIAKELGHQSVIVLGHHEYYPKFGFEKASRWDINAPFEVPEEAFMALELEKNALQHVSGIVEYSSAFSE
ncbi:N-acetyltransferase [Psychrobacillus sp.]|uniref:GNAT family N-acetyltransferase n=1 Tax=Psychrobacillus sp. TaxID=1871623 RepID=UPI0028BD19AB|nr:N-acetyltransferase [Psychrobacillus sp.]